MNTADVLIVGAGYTGLETALHCAAGGKTCIVVEKSGAPGGLAVEIGHLRTETKEKIEQALSTPSIRILCNSNVEKIRGVRGHFSVTTQTDGADESGNETDFRVDQIVFAVGMLPALPDSLSEIAASGNVITLWDLEQRISAGDDMPNSSWALFLSGFHSPGHAFSFQCILQNALRLRQQMNVLVVSDQVRLDTPWSEKLYRECREKGVLFTRPEKPPELVPNEDGSVAFKLTDLSLGSDESNSVIHGTANPVVVEPTYQPVTVNNLFWSPHRLDVDEFGCHRINRHYLYPVYSNREGIYLAGAVTGPKNIETCRREAALTAGAVLKPVQEHVYAIVDEEKCAACLTCVRICPHGAVEMDGTAQISEAACAGCGACEAECPATAIRMEKTDATPNSEPVDLVVYCCEGSSSIAMKRLIETGKLNDLTLRVIHLPCAGNLELVQLINQFVDGAPSVLIAACRDLNCRHSSGNRKALTRVHRAREILSDLGLDPERIAFINTASNMPDELETAIRQRCVE